MREEKLFGVAFMSIIIVGFALLFAVNMESLSVVAATYILCSVFVVILEVTSFLRRRIKDIII